MTPQNKNRALTAGAALTATLGAIGWLVPAGAKAVDQRYVHRDTFAVIQAGAMARARADSTWQALVLAKLDSLSLRVTQIQCGRRVQDGCR